MTKLFGGGGSIRDESLDAENAKRRKEAEEEKARLDAEKEARSASRLAARQGRRSLLNKDTREKGVQDKLGAGSKASA